MHGRKEKGRGEGASAAGFTKSEGGIHTLFSQKRREYRSRLKSTFLWANLLPTWNSTRET